MHFDPTPEEEPYRVELVVRSLAPPGGGDRRQSVVDHLRRFDDEDRIRSYSVTVWGNRIRLDVPPSTDPERAIRDRFGEFRPGGGRRPTTSRCRRGSSAAGSTRTWRASPPSCARRSSASASTTRRGCVGCSRVRPTAGPTPSRTV